MLPVNSTCLNHFKQNRDFSGGSVVKNPPANAEDASSVPGLGRSPAEGNGNSLQYSCLENPMDRGAWQAEVHGVAQNRTRLKRLSSSSKYALLSTLMQKEIYYKKL